MHVWCKFHGFYTDCKYTRRSGAPPRVKAMNAVLRSLLRTPLRDSKQGTATSESQMPPLPCCLPPAPCQVMDKARGSLWPDLDIGERERELIIRNSDQTFSQGISVGETEG